MKRLVLVIAMLTLACGTETSTAINGNVRINPDQTPTASFSTALELTPEIRPEGLDDLYSRLSVTNLRFYGAIYLVPVADNLEATSTSFKFELSDGVAETTTTGRPLRVERPGQYTVLMAVHPMGGESSIDVSGSVLAEEDSTGNKGGQSCREEAAPVTADEGEMEAAPTTADEEDMEAAPTTADEEEMEAAPTTADEEEMEAAPTTAEAAPTTSEAAPTTADCAAQSLLPLLDRQVLLVEP